MAQNPTPGQVNNYGGALQTGTGVIYDALGRPVVVGANMPAGAGAGKALVSDASGNLTPGTVGAASLPAATTTTQGAVIIDGTAADIQPAGIQAAGSVGKVADAGHVHPFTTAEALTSGESIYDRVAGGASGSGLTSQLLLLSYWRAATSGTATSVKTITTGTAASGLTYAAIGFYSVDGSGNLTLAGNTDDLHASLWISSSTPYTSTLTTTFTRIAGNWYAMGVLAVGTTPPTLQGPPGNAFYESAPILAGTVSGQSTLPASVATASVNPNYYMVQGLISP